MNTRLRWNERTWKGKALWKILCLALVLAVMAITLAIGINQYTHPAQATQCKKWYQCTISQYFWEKERNSPGYEHGVDLLTANLPITALMPGVITFSAKEPWDDPYVQDITWKLDDPACHQGKCEPYAYVEISPKNVKVKKGQRVAATTVLGYSDVFIEFGLTPDYEYGVSNWRKGIDPRFVLQNVNAAGAYNGK